MNKGADYGLNEHQIAQRNQMIEEIKTGLRNFNETYGLELPLTRFESRLEPGLPSNISGFGKQPIYDEAWVMKSRDYMRNDLIDYLTELILRNVASMGRGDKRLVGSSYAIALKLCTSHPLKHDFGFAKSRDELRLDCDTGRLGLTFDHIVQCVCERYERDYKTYRLWNDRALELLAQFLFRGAWDSILFDGGALWEKLNSEGEPVSLEAFIEGVNQTLLDLPMEQLTEVSFPDHTGVLFAEFVPAENMSREQKEQLYRLYVEMLKE